MEIKDRILKKAEDLFFVYGIKSVSMDELATSLGISKRTIYENFKDKEDILTSLMIKLRDDRNLAFQEYLSDDYNVVEVFLKVIEIQSQMPECNAKFFQDIYKYYPKVAALIRKIWKRIIFSYKSFCKRVLIRDIYVKILILR